MTVFVPDRYCCRRCRHDHVAKLSNDYFDFLMRLPTRMIVCPQCGNKRCPKADDHQLSCTGSNEPGQPGSSFPAFREVADGVPAVRMCRVCDRAALFTVSTSEGPKDYCDLHNPIGAVRIGE